MQLTLWDDLICYMIENFAGERAKMREFLVPLTAKGDDIDDYKVRWPPKAPRPPHIQKVSGSIPFRVLSSAAVVAAAFGGASGHAAGNGGSSSGAGAIQWCCCQCISTTGAGGAAGVGTDVVL